MIPKRIPKKFKIKFGFHFLSLNSKEIQMEAADRPPIKITGNDPKKDSKEI